MFIRKSKYMSLIAEYNKLCEKYVETRTKYTKLLVDHIQLEKKRQHSLSSTPIKNIIQNQLSADEIKTLIVLCHPDKHRGKTKTKATEMTSKLLEMRKH